MSKRLSWRGPLVVALVALTAACPLAYKAPVPVRGYLAQGQQPEADLGAYGYLLFTTQPSAQTRPRYLRVCESYRRSLVNINQFPRDDKGTPLMITYWLVRQRLNRNAEPSCAQLVDNYDYATATQIASAVQRFKATGPVLVAWQKPFGQEQQGEALLLDMSDFSDEDLDRAFDIWKDRIARDPSVWNNGFSYVKTREAFRNLISRYGEQIVSIIKPSK
jgi:hypothetical protein